jgi:hypothetical protein
VQLRDGFGVAAGVYVADGEIAAGDGGEGIEFARVAKFGDALVGAVEVPEEFAIPLMGGGVVGVELDGLAEVGFGLRKIPLVAVGFKGQGGIGLG